MVNYNNSNCYLVVRYNYFLYFGRANPCFISYSADCDYSAPSARQEAGLINNMAIKLTTKKDIKSVIQAAGINFFKYLWGESWVYVKTVVNVAKEPVLILDKNFRIMAANEAFYQEFKVKAKDTEGNILFELGNGQWDIPALHRLLESILPKNSFFKGFGVTHNFPIIGQRVIILNARQMYFDDDASLKLNSPIILLAMEDITNMMAIAEDVSGLTNELETKLLERTEKLEVCIQRLEREIIEIKKKL